MESSVSRGWQVLGWLGVVAHLLVGVWYAVSGLVAPPWGVAVLLIIWGVGGALIVRWIRSRPGLVVAIPVAEVAIWFAFISAGGALFGWTA